MIEGVGEQSELASVFDKNGKGVSMATPFPFLSKTDERRGGQRNPGQQRGGHRNPPSMQSKETKKNHVVNQEIDVRSQDP
jgi:protein tyrosine/serine phosphatase